MVSRINLSLVILLCVLSLVSINGVYGIRLNQQWSWAAPKTAAFSEVVHVAAAQPQQADGATGANNYYCVARADADATQLQAALDWACSQIDCSAIQSGGACYNGGLVVHASYAFDVYYSSHASANSCNFSGLATLTTANPSTGSCIYPAAQSSASSNNSSSTLAPPAPPSPGYGGAVTPPSPPSSVASPPSPSTGFSSEPSSSNTTLSPPMKGTSPAESILPNVAAPSLASPASFVYFAVFAVAMYM